MYLAPRRTSLDPLKLKFLIIFDAFWVYQASADMLNIIMLNSQTPCSLRNDNFQVPCWCPSANSYWWNFDISAVCSSADPIFGFLLLPCAWEIELWVYQLWRMDFLGICWFSNIFGVLPLRSLRRVCELLRASRARSAKLVTLGYRHVRALVGPC